MPHLILQPESDYLCCGFSKEIVQKLSACKLTLKEGGTLPPVLPRVV